MKKFLPYILIFTIFVQLFAPFSVAPGTRNDLKIVKNELRAADEECKIVEEGFTNPVPLPTSIEEQKPPSFTYQVKTTGCKNKFLLIRTKVENSFAVPIDNKWRNITSDIFSITIQPGEKYGCENGGCNKVRVDIIIRDNLENRELIKKTSDNFLSYKCSGDSCSNNFEWRLLEVQGLSDAGQTYDEIKVEEAKDESGFPACRWDFWNTIGGCIGIGMYYIFFVPTSLIFGLTGKVLDFTFMYSISDEAYRSGFVVQGWGIVRDFCNMFFIFILLYIAFGTILGLHSVKTKEMIVNVVIIGLLINFSLFATQVIIDASNILARVFYNQNTIVTGIKDPKTGIIKNELGEFNEIKLSEAIVSKVDPQKLVIESKKVSGIPQKGIDDEEDEGNISGGSFIIVVILATIINIVGMIAFLSAGLIFISRVIGLWLAMIVSPLVFFSYTVPALQDMEMVGWKKWWPETIKLAFLAPVFAFFMYLIVGFMDKGLGVIEASHKDGVGLGFLVAIIVPFVFIMILLVKAKDIAKDMSGKMGQSITNGVAAAGGIALGGAALGTAMLGRRVVGQTTAKASRGETSTQKYEAARGNPAAMAELTRWEKAKGAIGSRATFGLLGKAYGKVDPTTGEVKKGLGGLLNRKQEKVGEIDKARSEMDKSAVDAGVVGADGKARDRKEMSGLEVKKVEDSFKKTKRSEIENEVKKGFNSKGAVALTDINGNTLKDSNGRDIVGEEAFKSAKRNEVKDSMIGAPGSTQRAQAIADKIVERNGKLTKLGEEKLRNELNMQLNAAVKVSVDVKLDKDFNKTKEKAETPVNPLARGVAGVNTNSFDIRKLSDLKSDKRESGLFSKIPIALISGIATGVRAGMKNVGVSNGGIKVEGDFLKDLGNVISDSLKGIKINVDLSHVGENKSSADPHGGGGHH